MIMKQTVLILSAAVAFVAGAPVVWAAPFNPKDVAADPALLVHVDCDALRTCTVGQSILSEPEVQEKLAMVGAIFDFDFTKQLHGLTVYTTEAHPKDGALIVYADIDPNRLIALAKAQEGFHGVTNGSRIIYSWVDEKKKAKGDDQTRVYGAIEGHRVIIGQDETHLADALDVMDGKKPSFAGKKGLPEAEGGESIILEGLLLKFDFDGADEKAAIFKMSKSVRLKLSEVAQQMTATVRFEAADADTGTQIGNIAQGLLSLVKLQKNDADLMKLANAIAIKQDGPVVGLTLTVPSSELVGIIKDGQKKEEAKKAKESADSSSEKK